MVAVEVNAGGASYTKRGKRVMERNRVNKVAMRTQKAISDAFLELIRERAYEDISVTDLCRRADVVRKTFYNNFRSKDDVVHYLIAGFFRETESTVDLQRMSVRQIRLVAFGRVMENREALLLFYGGGSSGSRTGASRRTSRRSTSWQGSMKRRWTPGRTSTSPRRFRPCSSASWRRGSSTALRNRSNFWRSSPRR